MQDALPNQFSPQFLSAEQIMDPYLVLTDFSSSFDLKYLRSNITTWLKSVYSPADWSDKSPGDLYLLYQEIIKVLESVWLINQMNTTDRLANINIPDDADQHYLLQPHLFCRANHQALPWEQFPRFLGYKEFAEPYRVFSKLFNMFSLGQWKQQLHYLLQLSLDGFTQDLLSEVADLLTIYINLNKLAEACHLIYIREFETKDGKLILKSKQHDNNEQEKTPRPSTDEIPQ